MSDDRELLEAAARAIGLRYHGYVDNEFFGRGINTGELDTPLWNPLSDDGDALRLAVKLNLLVLPYPKDNAIRVTRLDQPDTIVSFGSPPNPYDATRRAIVRAAAEIAWAAPAHPGEGEEP